MIQFNNVEITDRIKNLIWQNMYIFNVCVLLVRYVKSLKFSQYWSHFIWNIPETSTFSFCFCIWQHVKNTSCNLVLLITQGGGMQGGIIANYCPILKHFFQTSTTYIFCRLSYHLALTVVTERTLGVHSEKLRSFKLWLGAPKVKPVN